MNYRYGAGAFGITVQDAGAVPAAVGSAVISSSPYFQPQSVLSAVSTMIAGPVTEGEAGQCLIFGTSVMTSSGQYTPGGQAVMSGTTAATSSGDIAWKGQTGSSITWTIQRQHPNG